MRSDTSLFEMSQLGSVIDRQTLDQKMASDMFRALQNETGVLLQQTGRGQLSPFIRGLTGQQIVVLIDGIRTNTSILRAGPNQYAATVDPGMIERIEVIRGANSVLWGSDAMGGVINIVTRGADSTRGDYGGGSIREIFGTADMSSCTRGMGEGWREVGRNSGRGGDHRSARQNRSTHDRSGHGAAGRRQPGHGYRG